MNTFNPFERYDQRLNNIEALSLEMLQILRRPQLDTSTEAQPISVSEAAEFLGISPQTLYQNAKRIPHRKRFGKLYFFKAELLDYLNGKEARNE
ncbi:hypothetical protein GCM10027299_42270 [Larkinella ripae]